MSDDPALDNLKEKLQKAKETVSQKTSHKKPAPSSATKFFNVGAELVAGVFVGAGMGLFIDWVFNISPWGLICFFILGSAAGMLNVYRSLLPKKTEKDKKPPDV